MPLHLRRPSRARLEELLKASRADDLTYAPVGAAVDATLPTTLHRDRWETALGGADAFDRGRQAVLDWRVHLGAGLSVVTDGELRVGTNVAMVAPLPVGYIEATCRITAVIDEPDAFGFAYGTLSVHPERGEESFIISRTDDQVRFVVAAASEPAHPLARLAPPIARRLQDTACKRYLAAMTQATA
jgi:uncharacterized protein (UPF0548 family)